MRCFAHAIILATSAHAFSGDGRPSRDHPTEAREQDGHPALSDEDQSHADANPAGNGWDGGVSAFGGPRWEGEDGLSICDKYTADLFGEDNRDTQASLMTIYVNTAMGGNFTPINNGIFVPGVVNPGSYHGKPINQMPWFNGELNSTNFTPDQGHGFPVNWLDGGGPAALHQNLTAFTHDSNQQYVSSPTLNQQHPPQSLTAFLSFFILHLHEYFAYLLGCSIYGVQVDRYNGSTNMYHVHKYMDLSNDMEQYTNLQFVLSAKSLGFSEAAQAYIGKTLQWLFSFKCAKPISVPEWAPPASQSICSVSHFVFFWFYGHSC